MKGKLNKGVIMAVLAFLLSTVSFSKVYAETTLNAADTKTGYHLEVKEVKTGSVKAKDAVDVSCTMTGLNPTAKQLKNHVADDKKIVSSMRVVDCDAGGKNDTVTHKRLVIVMKDGREYTLAGPYVDANNGYAGYAYYIMHFAYVKILDQWCFVGSAHYWLGTTNGDSGMPEVHDSIYNYSYTVYEFVANEYKVNYSGNGADNGSVTKQSCTYDTAFSIRGNKFVRAGYTFTGWNTEKNGSGTDYSPSQSVKNLTETNDGTVTLYAQWQVNTGTIYYNANGGEISDKPHYDAAHAMYYALEYTGSGIVYQTSDPNQNYTKVTNTLSYSKKTEVNLYSPGTFHLTKTGYHLDKGQEWFNSAYVFDQDSKDASCPVLAGLKSLLNLSDASGGSVMLYANWKINTYSIAYDGNGAESGSVTTQTATYDVALDLQNNAFVKAGYKFTGWNTKADGSGTAYSEGQSVSNLTATNNEIVTMYAQWKASNYTIHFDGNGSNGGSMEDVVATVDVETTLPANAFTRTTDQGNSSFKGWNVNKDSVSADYTDASKVTNLTDQPNTTVTLYAIWDDCPQITAVDRYFTLDYATVGKITEEELLSTARGTDREDVTLENRTAAQVTEKGITGSLTISDYELDKFTSLTSDAEVILTYLATDSFGNTYSEPVTVHIYSTAAKDTVKKYTRFIDYKNFNRSYEDGGLSPDSIWITNSEYHKELVDAFTNLSNDTPVKTYNFKHEQVEEAQDYITEHGFADSKENGALQGFYDRFLKPQDEEK